MYLIDANLPRKISAWQGPDFEFVVNINEELTDTEIWNYARLNGQTIVSKDADFSHRIMASRPPPKIIHIRIGNMRLKELSAFLESTWQAIALVSGNHKLVNVFRDRIEAVE